jgi:hypothetical protein
VVKGYAESKAYPVLVHLCSLTSEMGCAWVWLW